MPAKLPKPFPVPVPAARRRAGKADPHQASPVRGQERQVRERSLTRDAILMAAINLYQREGYGAVTMRAIANQLGFSAPAIYNYFLSKEEIFVALQEIGFRLMADAVLQPATDEPLHDLRSIFVEYYGFAKMKPEYFTLLYVDPSTPHVDLNFPDLKRMSDETALRMQRCLDAGVFPAGSSPAIASVLWSMVHGAAVLRQVQAMAPGTNFDAVAVGGLDLAIAAFRAGLEPSPIDKHSK